MFAHLVPSVPWLLEQPSDQKSSHKLSNLYRARDQCLMNNPFTLFSAGLTRDFFNCPVSYANGRPRFLASVEAVEYLCPPPPILKELRVNICRQPTAHRCVLIPSLRRRPWRQISELNSLLAVLRSPLTVERGSNQRCVTRHVSEDNRISSAFQITAVYVH